MKSYTGPIFILIAATLWAFDGLIRRHLYPLPPITIIFLEHLFGLIILFPFVGKYLFKTKFTSREWWLLILISLLSGLLGTLWFTTALVRVNFVTFKNGYVNLETGASTIVAALYALGAAFAWGSSTTFSKMLLGKVDFKVSTFYRFLITLIIALPVLLFFGHGSSLAAPTASQFGFLALIAVSTGMVALLIYYRGLARTPVHISTILELTFPFIAIFLDMLVNKTTLSLSQWVAALVLVFSIYKIARLREKIV